MENYEKQVKFSSHLNEQDMEILKSKICGYLAADGSVTVRKEKGTNRFHYDVRFYPDHYALVRHYKTAFKKIYGKDVNVRRERNYFYARTSSKPAATDLLSIANFSSRCWTLPTILKSEQSKKTWLRAYFDCDGYVCRRYVQVQSVNKKGLIKIKNLLNGFGIRSRLYSYQRRQKSWNTNHILTIPGKTGLLNFMREIGFDHPSKRAKLKEFTDNIKRERAFSSAQ
jgi:hypothetical protein